MIQFNSQQLQSAWFLCTPFDGGAHVVRACLRPPRTPGSSSPFADSYARFRPTLLCEACSSRFPIELMRPRRGHLSSSIRLRPLWLELLQLFTRPWLVKRSALLRLCSTALLCSALHCAAALISRISLFRFAIIGAALVWPSPKFRCIAASVASVSIQVQFYTSQFV